MDPRTIEETKVVREIESTLLFGGHRIDGSDSDDNVYATLQHLWSSLGIIEGVQTKSGSSRREDEEEGNNSVPMEEEEEEEDNDKDSSDESMTNPKKPQEPRNDKDEKDDPAQNGHDQARQEWYQWGADYWQDEETCPATVNGVLGGFAILSDRDLAGSRRFLQTLYGPQVDLTQHFSTTVSHSTCCECGAGIGRVSKGLLLPLGFAHCDLVESSPRLLAAAPAYIGEPEASSRCRYLNVGLQDFAPRPDSYHLIWVQWVVGYLTDYDLREFFQRCARALQQGGYLVLKDNTTGDAGAFELDTQDSSLTRSVPYLKTVASMAGLTLVLEQCQTDFPAEIFPVPLLAFAPAAAAMEGDGAAAGESRRRHDPQTR